MSRRTSIWAQLRRFARNRCGGPAVEFALTAPILVLLIMGIITIGFEVEARIQVREAVRAGAHAVMAGEDDPAVIRQIVLNALERSSDDYAADVRRESRCGSTVVNMEGACASGEASQQYFIIDLAAPAGVAYRDAPAISARIEVRIT
jgi:Flp pilus assembly protein TadG